MSSRIVICSVSILPEFIESDGVFSYESKNPFTTRTHENSTKNQPHKLNRILESKAQKGTFFKCSDKNESFYLQKV
ncbi:hypothetical protein, partial [Leptospira interrogans]|uniref:hypothetical protein n=1 Tax=Leptospira interrogans TaxID=173 RepID=UPI001F255280